ncbi:MULTISPECIES: PepSY domain-containing protein [Paracoccus]|uniref:PepSY domain-containing protein n=1 Tax=Paracoccus TaxID=265 RepID=UPI001FB6843C|nr:MULTISPECIES: PepSY domain-containing protein [Paracoccus]MCJ1900233.1 PepSY domain-containing protein [Paracoccus versutus]MDF3904883.1 PepSY domain-containing protein [Paracoccus sp. AS002]
MRLVALIPAILALATPAVAHDRCHVPQDQRRPANELRADLAAKGWIVRKIEMEDGCYEVHGQDRTGLSVEVLFDPASFQEMGRDD